MPGATEPEPQIDFEPAASAPSDGGISVGTDLIVPLLLVSAAAALALATRYTLRSLHQE